MDLGLIVETEHNGPLGWVEIETDDVDDFGFNVRVGGDLEGVHLSWLQVVVPPDPSDRVLADTDVFGQKSGRPVGRAVIGGLVQRVADYGGNAPLS